MESPPAAYERCKCTHFTFPIKRVSCLLSKNRRNVQFTLNLHILCLNRISGNWLQMKTILLINFSANFNSMAGLISPIMHPMLCFNWPGINFQDC